VLNQRNINSHSFGIELQSGNANIAAYGAEGLKAWYGIEGGCHSGGGARGLRFRAFSVGVKSLKKVEKFLKKKKVASRKIAHRLVIDHAEGQGCVIAFEEVKTK
jgi:hypothetical protein